jgi:ketosteroid isomerase-like protein
MKLEQSGYETADEAEEAFYGAFATCDRKVMETIWADDEVVCVHPGSAAIFGYDEVIRSWSTIFLNASLPDILFTVVSAIENSDLAVHMVEEHIATGDGTAVVILATNVFQQFEEGWLMIEHHASVIQSPIESYTLQ